MTESTTAHADEPPFQALEGVLPKLNQLEERLAEGRAGEIAGLQGLRMVESLGKLETLIEEQRTEFDTLHFVGQASMGSGRALWASEEFHSNVLAWLLDPHQTHGIGDRFLKALLRHGGAKEADTSASWSMSEVTREWPNEVDGQWGYLDILVLNESHRAFCAIENKVFSTEHSEQLTRYRRALERSFPSYSGHLVFLTPGGTSPFREKERACWTSLPYSIVLDALQQIVEDGHCSENEDVRAFLRQYATTLRRNIMPDTSVPQLARQIYLEHREAIDRIVAHKPSYVAEAKQWLKEAAARQEQWILDVEDSLHVRFRSAEWDRYPATQTGTGWAPTGSNALLLFEFTFWQGYGCPWLRIALSPSDPATDSLRDRLFEAAKQHPQLFNSRPSPTAGWLILHDDLLHDDQNYILSPDDLGLGWDDGTTRAKLDAWVEDFAANQFPAMNQVIVKCLKEYEAEQQKQGQEANP